MDLLYNSTRGGDQDVTASRAILAGLASDGGLYMPDHIPALDLSFDQIRDLAYADLAYEILRRFFTDFTEEELKSCIRKAYDAKFDTPVIAPLVKQDDAYYLELFHGPTIAFKDMALQVLPHLLATAAKKQQAEEKIVILTATSGDTGKAAMEGFADVPGTEIIVFYPKDGVSPVQERQMVTQTGANTHVAAIRGNFDDAQSAVKKLFRDEALISEMKEAGLIFSSANSINIGRLVPQIVYYVYAYAQMMQSGAIEAGEEINVAVPTGNFGNILAAYFAKQMGLPVAKLICASNQNRVLTDFFEGGTYDKNRPFYLSSSPSMDILISSNLERLLYLAADLDTELVASLMRDLQTKGRYEMPASMREKLSDFLGMCADEDAVSSEICRLYQASGYVIDPHTAVASAVLGRYKEETGDQTKTVIASTASPYKFARAVLHAIDAVQFDAHDDYTQFADLAAVSSVPWPKAVKKLAEAEVRHDLLIDPEMMRDTVRRILKLA